MITIDDYLEGMARGEDLPRRCVAITLDDGYRDNLELALPLLEAAGMPATIFLVTDCVGGRRTWGDSAGQGAQLLSWEEIRDMRGRGVGFGAHSRSHPDLRHLTSEQARSEIDGSRDAIATELGAEPRVFCFPYSGSSEQLRRLVAEAGFEAACTYRPHYVGDAGLRPFDLQRIGVLASDRLNDFESKLRGHWRRHRLRAGLRALAGGRRD